MRVIAISGKGRSGKDTIAAVIKQKLDEKGIPSLVVHYADFLKMILEKYYNIDCSVKTPEIRERLQFLGTDVFRKNNPDGWVNMMIEFIRMLGDTVKVLVISDIRFPNECILLRDSMYVDGVFTVRIERSGDYSDLTEEQKKHPSETAMDNYKFDLVVRNDSDLETYKAKAEEIVRLYEFSQKKETPVI